MNQIDTIKNEFILVKGDVITNANIHEAFKRHCKIRSEDSDNKLILTKIFVKVPFSNPIRHQSQECCLILDDGTKEILKYESFQHGSKKMKLNEDYISLKK